MLLDDVGDVEDNSKQARALAGAIPIAQKQLSGENGNGQDLQLLEWLLQQRAACEGERERERKKEE